MTSRAIAVVVGLSLAGPLSSPAVAVAAEEAAPTAAQLEVELVLSRYQGDERVANLPYTLRLSEGTDRSTRLRVGVEVPVRTGEGAVQYRNVGTQIDCTAVASPEAGGAVELRLSIEHSAVVPAADADAPFQGAPMFSTFQLRSVVELHRGESAELVGSTDPVTGEVMRIRLTLRGD